MFINNRTGITTQGWILENALKNYRYDGRAFIIQHKLKIFDELFFLKLILLKVLNKIKEQYETCHHQKYRDRQRPA